MSHIKVDFETCTGCRYCEVICAFNKDAVGDPYRSRIRVDKDEAEGQEVTIVCRQCQKPECVESCPTQALSKDEATGVVLYDRELCIMCLACITACPYDSIWHNERLDTIIKCDTCGGDPACVKYCPTKSLSLVE